MDETNLKIDVEENSVPFKIFLPHEIVEDNWKHFKPFYIKYIPLMIIMALLGIGTFSFSFLFLYSSTFGFNSILFAFIGMIISFVLFLFPSYSSLLTTMYIDISSLKDERSKGMNIKSLFKTFFSNFYFCYSFIFRRKNKLLSLFLKTLVVFTILFLVIVVPSLYFKRYQSEELYTILLTIESNLKVGNLSYVFENLVLLDVYLKLEYTLTFGLTMLFFIYTFLKDFYERAYYNAPVNFKLKVQILKKSFKNAYKNNRWAFNFYYYFCCKTPLFFIFITYILSTIICYFIIPISIMIPFVACLITFLIMPFFMTVYLDYLISICDSFSDLFLIALTNETQNLFSSSVPKSLQKDVNKTNNTAIQNQFNELFKNLFGDFELKKNRKILYLNYKESKRNNKQKRNKQH